MSQEATFYLDSIKLTNMYYTYTHYADVNQMVEKSMPYDDADEDIDWGVEDVQPDRGVLPSLHRAHVAQRQAMSQVQQEDTPYDDIDEEDENEEIDLGLRDVPLYCQAELDETYKSLGLNALKSSIDELKEGPEYKVLQALHSKTIAAVNVYFGNKNEEANVTLYRSITTAIDEAKADPTLESRGKNILNFFIKLINKVLPKDKEISLVETERKKQVTDFSEKFKEVREELKKIIEPPIDSPNEQNGLKSP